MTLADFPQLESLSQEEKLKLLDELWESIALDLGPGEVPEAECQVLDARWQQFLHDPSTAITTEEFIERIRSLRA